MVVFPPACPPQTMTQRHTCDNGVIPCPTDTQRYVHFQRKIHEPNCNVKFNTITLCQANYKTNESGFKFDLDQKNHPMADDNSSVHPSASKITSSFGLLSPVNVLE